MLELDWHAKHQIRTLLPSNFKFKHISRAVAIVLPKRSEEWRALTRQLLNEWQASGRIKGIKGNYTFL